MKYISSISFLLCALLVNALFVGCQESSIDEPMVTDEPETMTRSFIVLPDTQYYSCYYNDIFLAQTSWIAENRDALGIAIILHLGDIVDINIQEQWEIAKESLYQLNDQVPYLLVTGNHDMDAARKTLLNEAFDSDDLSQSGRTNIAFMNPGHVENAFALVEIRGSPWLFLGIEFGPRDQTLEWANEVLKQYSKIPAILFTHAYLYSDNARYDREIEPPQPYHPDGYQVTPDQGIADGQDIWETVVEPNENVRFVFSGHVAPDGIARSQAMRSSGSIVHEILSDYQFCDRCPCQEVEGGGGFLRIYELNENSQEFRVSTYSPFYDRYLTDTENAFRLRLTNEDYNANDVLPLNKRLHF